MFFQTWMVLFPSLMLYCFQDLMCRSTTFSGDHNTSGCGQIKEKMNYWWGTELAWKTRIVIKSARAARGLVMTRPNLIVLLITLKHCARFNEVVHTGKWSLHIHCPERRKARDAASGCCEPKWDLMIFIWHPGPSGVELDHLTDMIPSEEEVEFQGNIKVI